ncbi:hypothetical protein MTR_6g043970 [Medicago truncatula]|uniref:Uncharacterized protein n=1 Tax=Medicago truncatula TaxID=3880 RepID=A0A072UJQ5_MEDTR|nr:hypothetical protein MTR_6g043970 [Medicago truncatula]
MVCHQQQLQRFDDDNVNLSIQLHESTPSLMKQRHQSTPPLIKQRCKSTPPLMKQRRKSIPPLMKQRHLIGVFSSYLKHQKSFSSQTKSTGKLTQLSTTFMLTPKANSKQKRVKNTQEREIGDAVKVQLARRVSLLAVASCDGQIYGNRLVFTPKAPISSIQIPNLIGNSTYVYPTG